MKAIILAAGKGSRLHPLTEHTPKPLVEVGGRPILDHIIEQLPDSIDEVIIITKHLEDVIKNHIADRSVEGIYPKKYTQKVSTISQGKHTGTYGALLTVKDLIDEGERFLVMNGDDLHEKSELESYLLHPLSGGIQHRIMPAYFASEPDADGIIRALRPQTEQEKIHGAPIATGVYLLDNRVFNFPPVEIFGGELGLPQTLLAQSDIYPIHAVVTKNWQPVNDFDDLAEAQKRFI